MLNKLKNNRNSSKGFTIIEVLIVLAIAGLILLVVFLAVPALQRNQRNQGYRSEANRLLAAAQEVSANNGGSKLTLSACTETTAPTCASDTAQAAKIFQAANAKNIKYVQIVSGSSAVAAGVSPSYPAAGAAGAVTDQVSLVGVTLFTGAKCVGQDKYAAGTSRQTVLMYGVEDNKGDVVVQCQES